MPYGRYWHSVSFDLPTQNTTTLNVDWFRPFKLGVLYIAINNLPGKDRFLPNNIMIVGIIPGPHEPSKNINTFLYPLCGRMLSLRLIVC